MLVRDVARHFGESTQVARFVTQGGDYDASPKARPILAHSPTFAFELAVALGLLQCAGWFLGSPVFRCVEDREVPADDLISSIALDPLCAFVPADDRSL